MQTRLSGKPTSRDPRTNIAIGTIRAPAEKLGTTSCHFDKKFYETNYPDPDTKTSAQIVLNHVLNLIPGVESAVDVGCGTGVWFSVLKRRGSRRSKVTMAIGS